MVSHLGVFRPLPPPPLTHPIRNKCDSNAEQNDEMQDFVNFVIFYYNSINKFANYEIYKNMCLL